MAAGDVDAAAVLHRAAFPQFFLSSLGTGALRELYAGILDDPDGVAIVASSESRLLGLAAGSLTPAGFYSRLLRRRWWRFGLALAIRMVTRPSLLWRISRRVRASSAMARPGEARLMSLAVAPDAQNRGLGAQLTEKFLDAARERGAKCVSLTTDAVDNVGVVRFYERLGFRRRDTITTSEGRHLFDYVHDL